MAELEIFKNEDFGEIRAKEENGEIWFCLKDVCEILEIKNVSNCKSRLNSDGVGTTEVIDNMGRTQKATFINESNLYKVIFQSRKQEAEKFTEWVTSEVLPSIRKHGTYMTSEILEQAILNPDTMIKLCTALKDEQEKNKALKIVNSRLTVDNTIMQPKADYFDELVDRNLLTNFRETAKQLEFKEKEFISFLINKKFLYRDKKGKLVPYAKKNNGLFELKETFNEKTNWSGTQTLITPKGRETFRLLYLKVA